MIFLGENIRVLEAVDGMIKFKNVSLSEDAFKKFNRFIAGYFDDIDVATIFSDDDVLNFKIRYVNDDSIKEAVAEFNNIRANGDAYYLIGKEKGGEN